MSNHTICVTRDGFLGSCYKVAQRVPSVLSGQRLFTHKPQGVGVQAGVLPCPLHTSIRGTAASCKLPAHLLLRPDRLVCKGGRKGPFSDLENVWGCARPRRLWASAQRPWPWARAWASVPGAPFPGAAGTRGRGPRPGPGQVGVPQGLHSLAGRRLPSGPHTATAGRLCSQIPSPLLRGPRRLG